MKTYLELSNSQGFLRMYKTRSLCACTTGIRPKPSAWMEIMPLRPAFATYFVLSRDACNEKLVSGTTLEILLHMYLCAGAGAEDPFHLKPSLVFGEAWEAGGGPETYMYLCMHVYMHLYVGLVGLFAFLPLCLLMTPTFICLPATMLSCCPVLLRSPFMSGNHWWECPSGARGAVA